MWKKMQNMKIMFGRSRLRSRTWHFQHFCCLHSSAKTLPAWTRCTEPRTTFLRQ